MAYLFNITLFLALSTALLVLALRPAWQEWRHPTDVRPLLVEPNYTSSIDHFADEFRAIALTPSNAADMAQSQQFDTVAANFNAWDWAHARRPLIALASVQLGKGTHCPQAVFVTGSFDGAEDTRLCNLLVQGNMRLGANSAVTGWAHADGVMHLESGCTALRRISSSIAVQMDKECCFERVHAPVVRMGISPTVQPARTEMPLILGNFGDLRGAINQTATLTLVRGDCILPAGRLYHGSLIVTGRLFIGERTEIRGAVKARAGAIVGPQVRIEGALVSEKQIQILEQASILGPVISETVILIGAHCRLGMPLLPTTVSAQSILAEAGSIVHGTVWARDLGVVWST